MKPLTDDVLAPDQLDNMLRKFVQKQAQHARLTHIEANG